MAYELVCQTTQHGLDPGSSGFCAVGRSTGFPIELQQPLEGFSSLANGNRPGALHVAAELNGEVVHVVGRLLAVESDSARRPVELAHFVVPKTNELPDAGPGWLASSSLFLAQWNGKPREIDEPVSIPAGAVSGRAASVWKQLTGSSQTAKRLASSVRAGEVVWVVYPSNVPILQLFLEASQLLPSDERWNATFCTDFDSEQFSLFETISAGPVQCLWRGVPEGSREIAKLRVLEGARIVNLVKQVREHETVSLDPTSGVLDDENVSGRATFRRSRVLTEPEPEPEPEPETASDLETGRKETAARRSTERRSTGRARDLVDDASASDTSDESRVLRASADQKSAIESDDTFKLRPRSAASETASDESEKPQATGGTAATRSERERFESEEIPASREPASRERASRERASREPAGRERASREPASREPASREPAARTTAQRRGQDAETKRSSEKRKAGNVDVDEEFDDEIEDYETTDALQADSGLPQGGANLKVSVDYRKLAAAVVAVLLIGFAVTVVPGLIGNSSQTSTVNPLEVTAADVNASGEAAANVVADSVAEEAEDFSERIRNVRELAESIREWDGVSNPKRDLRSVSREMQKVAADLQAAPPNDEIRSTLKLAKDTDQWLERVYAAKQAIDPAVKLAGAQAGTVVTSEQIRQALEPVDALETEELPEALKQLIERTQALLNSVEGVDGGLGNAVRTVTLPRDSATVVIDASIPRRNLIDTFELTLTRRAADRPQQIREAVSTAGTDADSATTSENTAIMLRKFELTRGERRIGSLSFLQQGNADSEQGSALRLELKIEQQAEAGDLDRLEITLRGPLFRRVYRLQSE